jgi:hypothetical protein
MAEVEERTSIGRSAGEIWAVLADYGRISTWASNVAHSCLTTEQSEGVGTVRRVQVGRNALLERVVDWEHGVRLGYRIEGLPPVVRSAVNTWTLDTDGHDRSATTVTLTTRIDTGPRPPQQVAARVIARVLAKASREMLAGLEAYIEEAPR